MSKNNTNYKIVLKKDGNKKTSFFRIVVLTRSNKYRFYLGSIDMLSNKNTSSIHINKIMLFYWLYRGAKCSMIIYKLLNFLLLENSPNNKKFNNL